MTPASACFILATLRNSALAIDRETLPSSEKEGRGAKRSRHPGIRFRAKRERNIRDPFRNLGEATEWIRIALAGSLGRDDAGFITDGVCLVAGGRLMTYQARPAMPDGPPMVRHASPGRYADRLR